MEDYQLIKSNLQDLLAEKKYILSSYDKHSSILEDQKKALENILTARLILQDVAEKTQKNLEHNISNLVTLALNSVFNEQIQFGIDFVQKRGKTECIFYIEKNNNKIYDILNSDGGGIADVISLALRVAFLRFHKGFNSLILDEPMKFLHNQEAQEKVSEMLKMLSLNLGVQFIIVSDQNELTGDKKFRVINGCVHEESSI